jgi:Spy/CpxP family protein refolding chaperone
MKSNLNLQSRALALLVATGIFGSGVLLAAEAPPAQPVRQNPGGPGGPGGGPGRFGAMLDDQQRELLREAAQNQSDAIRKLGMRLQVAQKELMQAIMAEKSDEKVVREKADVVAKIQVEETLLRAKILAVVIPTLKPEQREQIENSPWMLNMVTGGGFGGGMRPGDPGARPPGGGTAPVRTR